MRTPREVRYLAALVVAVHLSSASAVDSWSIATNPHSSTTEAVWGSPGGGESSPGVFFASLVNNAWSASTELGSSFHEGSLPALGHTASGDRKVVWGTAESIPRILLRSQAYAGGSWSSDVVVSDPDVGAINPSLRMVGNTAYVAYESVGSSERALAVSQIDPGGGVERVYVATSTAAGTAAPILHYVDSTLWLDWIDSDTEIGYCAIVDGEPGAISYESYSGSSDIADARGRVQDYVLGF